MESVSLSLGLQCWGYRLVWSWRTFMWCWGFGLMFSSFHRKWSLPLSHLHSSLDTFITQLLPTGVYFVHQEAETPTFTSPNWMSFTPPAELNNSLSLRLFFNQLIIWHHILVWFSLCSSYLNLLDFLICKFLIHNKFGNCLALFLQVFFFFG